MQVKLSQTCELSQVPFKVSKILDERVSITKEHLDFFQVGVVNNLHNGKEPTLSMIDEIDKFRKTLYLLDAKFVRVIGDFDKLYAKSFTTNRKRSFIDGWTIF